MIVFSCAHGWACFVRRKKRSVGIVLPCLPAQPAPLAPVVLLSIFTINQTVRWGVVKIEAMQYPHDVSVAVAAPDIQERPAFRDIPKTPNKAWLEQPATSGTVTFRVVRHLISSVEFSRQRVPALQRCGLGIAVLHLHLLHCHE